MKKILILVLVALVTYSSSFAIGGFKVVIKKPGAAVDVQVRIVDYSPTGPTTEFTGATVSLTPNASGIIVASVPETPAILATDVNSFYIVEVWTGSPLTLSSQQRLDEMIFEQAQTGLTDNEGNVTLEPGKELIFPEPAGSGENFTSFKSPALAADVEYTLPINDGDANQYLKTDGSGVMSWDNPTVSTNTTIDGNGLTGSPLGLADNAVTTAKINNDAVTTGKIANGAVTTDKIGSSAVTDVKIGSSAVTTAKINNAAVTTDKINDGAVTEAKLADDAVATAKIEDKAVTAAKISPGATNGHVLTVSGTDAVWAAPAGGGGGSNTFFLEFTSFSNSSCCNDRSLNEADPYTAGAGISMNSTQPKPSYGQPFAVDLEVVSVSVYLNLTAKSLTAPVVFNVTPYIVNMTTGATDRALTSPIDLATLAEDQWHTISLSSSTPADNLVDASAGQYVMWELNSTHGGNWDDTEGVIMFRVEVKYP